MREIKRTIASALIFSKDKKLLMGRKDPSQGGVYSDCWHIPGGGLEEGETHKAAVIREVQEEIGLDISACPLEQLPHTGSGVSEKILKESGEKVLCHMEFNRFRIVLDKNAENIQLKLTDDLVEVRWFSIEELPNVKQVPGGKEFFQKLGYIPKDRTAD